MTLTEKVSPEPLTRPESKPPDNGEHGSEKLDWVTEWAIWLDVHVNIDSDR